MVNGFYSPHYIAISESSIGSIRNEKVRLVVLAKIISFDLANCWLHDER